MNISCKILIVGLFVPLIGQASIRIENQSQSHLEYRVLTKLDYVCYGPYLLAPKFPAYYEPKLLCATYRLKVLIEGGVMESKCETSYIEPSQSMEIKVLPNKNSSWVINGKYPITCEVRIFETPKTPK